jgi:polyisoprenoid-binding protein YceI
MRLSLSLPLLLAVATLSSAQAAPEKYVIDPEHTYPSLEMPHMGLSVWRGKFNRTRGEIQLDLAAKKGSVVVETDTGSIDFGLDSMHEHAVTPDWLNVEKYPKMTYRGELQFSGDKPVAVKGELTLRGVSKPLTLEIRRFACIDHPYYKKPVCGADAEAQLDRADWGMSQYTDNGMGRILVRIQVEAFKDALPAPPPQAAK